MLDAVVALAPNASPAEIDRIVELGRTRTINYPLELLNMPAGTAEMVAARAAGMKVIIYSKNNVPGADARTDLFTDLPKLIADL